MPRSDVRYTRPSDTPPSVILGDGVQHMVKCIDDDNGNGFVWHTNSSGKTLTSFKASTLLNLNDSIHKCVFVFDRKDLDRQTREDWSSIDKTSSEGEARRVSAGSAYQINRFLEGCAEKNTSTTALVRLLLSEDCILTFPA